jgi:ketopantoate reductase
MRILNYGAGVIGSVYGARLRQAGHRGQNDLKQTRSDV